jgi:hypothetical protein
VPPLPRVTTEAPSAAGRWTLDRRAPASPKSVLRPELAAERHPLLVDERLAGDVVEKEPEQLVAAGLTGG